MSDVLDYVRSKEPRFREVPDGELALYVASKEPSFLSEPAFRAEVEAEGKRISESGPRPAGPVVAAAPWLTPMQPAGSLAPVAPGDTIETPNSKLQTSKSKIQTPKTGTEAPTVWDLVNLNSTQLPNELRRGIAAWQADSLPIPDGMKPEKPDPELLLRAFSEWSAQEAVKRDPALISAESLGALTPIEQEIVNRMPAWVSVPLAARDWVARQISGMSTVTGMTTGAAMALGGAPARLGMALFAVEGLQQAPDTARALLAEWEKKPEDRDVIGITRHLGDLAFTGLITAGAATGLKGPWTRQGAEMELAAQELARQVKETKLDGLDVAPEVAGRYATVLGAAGRPGLVTIEDLMKARQEGKEGEAAWASAWEDRRKAMAQEAQALPPTGKGQGEKAVPGATVSEAGEVLQEGTGKAEVLGAGAAQAERPISQPRTPQTVAEAWEMYDTDEGIGTVSDLAKAVEGLIGDEKAPASLQRALDRYRRAVEEDFEMAGRSDLESEEEAFLKAIEKVAVKGKKTITAGAPETGTVRTGARGVTEGGEAPKAEPTAMTAEPGASPGRSAPAESAAPVKPRVVRTRRTDRPPDVIDWVEGSVGVIDPKLIREADPDWKPTGALRKIMRSGGHPADLVLEAGVRAGAIKGDPAKIDTLITALEGAVKERADYRTRRESEIASMGSGTTRARTSAAGRESMARDREVRTREQQQDGSQQAGQELRAAEQEVARRPSEPTVAQETKPKWFMGWRRVMAPQTIDESAGIVAGIGRYVMGKEYQALRQADFALRKMRRMFDRTPVPRGWVFKEGEALPRNYELMRRVDTGELEGLTPAELDFVRTMRSVLDESIAAVQEVSPNSLRELIENYFPRIWERQTEAQQRSALSKLSGHRPLEGSKGFLKQRVLAYFTDGLALGLKPVSDNPADLVLAKIGEMQRFVTGRRWMAEAKARGLRRFVYVYEKPPDAWVQVDDPSSNMYAPPTVTIKEAFDEQVRVKTTEMLERLGVPHERLARIGGKRWGYAERGSGRIVSKFGGPDFVLWHEFGHQMDWRYPELRRLLGADAGRGPLSTEMRALADLRGGRKEYVRRAQEKMANVFHAYVHAPELFRKTAPTVWKAFNEWLDRTPEVKAPLAEIRPSLRLGEGSTEMFVGGPVLLGRWMMPEGAAQVMKNYLAPGLGRFKLFRSLRDMASLESGVQLFGFFHGQFVMNDTFYSGMGLALHDAMKAGKTLLWDRDVKLTVAQGLRGGRSALPAAATATLFLTGHPVLALAPMAADVAAVVRKGAGIYRAIENPARATAEYKRLADLAVMQNLRAGHGNYEPQFARRWQRAVHEALAAPSTGAVWEAFWRTPLGAVETGMYPVLQYLVPRMKLGIFARMAERVLADNPGADQVTLRRLIAQAADATEDRLGQVTYDNMFQQRAVKDAMQLAMRAYGWQLTKYRMTFGGAADWARAANDVVHGRTPTLTFRMTYLPAMVAGHAILGGIVMQALTGRRPQTLKDYLFPESGLYDAYGAPVRMSIADFVKDYVADWQAFKWAPARPMEVFKRLGAEWSRKLGPMWNLLSEMYRNEDFYGTRIFSEGQIGEPALEHLLRNLGEAAVFVGKESLPFSARGQTRLEQVGGAKADALATWGPWFGLVPAPRYATMTMAETRAAELMRDQLPRGGMSADQTQRARMVAELVRDLRTGKVNSEGELEQRLRAAKVQGGAGMTMMHERVLWSPMQYQVMKLPVESAMEVFDLADERERVSLAPFLAEKLARAADGKRIEGEKLRRYVELVRPYWVRASAGAAGGPANGNGGNGAGQPERGRLLRGMRRP